MAWCWPNFPPAPGLRWDSQAVPRAKSSIRDAFHYKTLPDPFLDLIEVYLSFGMVNERGGSLHFGRASSPKKTRKATDFGIRLAQARKAAGLTQMQLADLFDVSQQMIDYYERRANNPTAAFIRKAAETLNVSVNELLGTECKPTRKPGPPSQLEARLEEVRKLPRQRQKLVLDLINTILRDPGRGNGHKQAA